MMKTIFAVLLAVFSLFSATSFGQRSCGNEFIYNELRKANPQEFQRLQQRQRQESQQAQDNAGALAKTAADQSSIPVVFHIVVSQSQYNVLGRDSGIRRRVITQLAVLNRDFNRGNADSALIPAPFKSRYGNANIQFGLANQTSDYTFNVGIEVKIITTTPNINVANAYRGIKENGTGLAAWDPSKFLNIWVINPPGGVLGVTVAPRNKGETWGDRVLDESDYGVVLNYAAFGVRENANQYFVDYTDQGRTLTHEIGHFFGLLHIWGIEDDVDPNGYCPGDMRNGIMVGFDDFINDTPPQSRSTYCVGSVCPPFPKLDACSPTSPGIMFMNYMDYVIDASMLMFTNGQVAVMRSQIAPGGPSFGLTQNPGLVSVGISKLSGEAFHLYPNPATTNIHIALGGTEKLQTIQLMSMTGQLVRTLQADGRRDYEIRTGELPRGLYFVQCRFAEGMLSRKIVLQ